MFCNYLSCYGYVRKKSGGVQYTVQGQDYNAQKTKQNTYLPIWQVLTTPSNHIWMACKTMKTRKFNSMEQVLGQVAFRQILLQLTTNLLTWNMWMTVCSVYLPGWINGVVGHVRINLCQYAWTKMSLNHVRITLDQCVMKTM